MVLQISHNLKHRGVVLSVYRKLLRNALNVDDFRSELVVHKIRLKFRQNRDAINAIVVQSMLEETVTLNGMLLKALNGEKSDLIKYIDTKIPNKEQILESSAAQSVVDLPKKSKNPIYAEAGMSEEDIQEFKETRTVHLPESSQKYVPNIKVHQNWYFGKKGIKIKGKLDKNYIHNILPSVISFEKQKYKLAKILKKLQSPSSAKIKIVSGTKHWISIINTPWNRDLRTEDFSWIGDVKRRYDDIVLEGHEIEEMKKQFQFWANEENKWEKLFANVEQDISQRETGVERTLSGNNQWCWVYEEAENDLKKRLNSLENEVILFNKRQHLIFNKIKPEFDKMDQISRNNAKVLVDYLKKSGTGSYTDIIDGGLDNIMKKHGF